MGDGLGTDPPFLGKHSCFSGNIFSESVFQACSRRRLFSRKKRSCVAWTSSFRVFLEWSGWVGCVLGLSGWSGLVMGWSGLIESVGLAQGNCMKTAHPSQIRDQGLFWTIFRLDYASRRSPVLEWFDWSRFPRWLPVW